MSEGQEAARPPSPRLSDVPELADVAEDLAMLSVIDVRIFRVAGDEDQERWGAVVVLSASPQLVLPWGLELRPTREDARGAVEELLRGLVAGRYDAMRLHPGVGGTAPLDLMEQEIAKAMRGRWR